MPHNVMILAEEEVGEGTTLVFPRFSTCTGVVATVGPTLVGAHFTADVWAGPEPAKHTAKLLGELKVRIGDRDITHLTIVGFNQHHNPGNIKAALSADDAACEAYDLARKNISEMTVMAIHQGADIRPRIEIKRQSKVTVDVHENPNWTPADRYRGQLGDVTINHAKELRKHFVGVL